MATTETDIITLDGGDALAAITRSEVDAQVATAHAYPRSLAAFRDRCISEATVDEDTAAACLYALPRGGKTIEGPSVRLAEIIAAAYGNIRVASRVISIDDKFVSAQGVAHDLESNYAVQMETKRSIRDKYGKRYKDDMIRTTALAACAVAYREAVFKVIPRALWWPGYLAARHAAVGDIETLAKRRTEMLAYFARFGITLEQVLALVECEEVTDVTLRALATLKGIASAIKDGEIDPEEAFKVAKSGAKVKAADDGALPKPVDKAKKSKAKKEDKADATEQEFDADADAKTERVVTQ